jgi:hypothetical protein
MFQESIHLPLKRVQLLFQAAQVNSLPCGVGSTSGENSHNPCNDGVVAELQDSEYWCHK